MIDTFLCAFSVVMVTKNTLSAAMQLTLLRILTPESLARLPSIGVVLPGKLRKTPDADLHSISDALSEMILRDFTLPATEVYLDGLSKSQKGLSENDVQRACVTAIKRGFPDCAVWHTPNENSQRKHGVLGGVSDLTVTWAGHTAYIELKDWKGKLSASQLAFLKARAGEGNHCAAFRHDEPLVEWLQSIGAPYRPTFQHKFIGEDS